MSDFTAFNLPTTNETSIVWRWDDKTNPLLGYEVEFKIYVSHNQDVAYFSVLSQMLIKKHPSRICDNCLCDKPKEHQNIFSFPLSIKGLAEAYKLIHFLLLSYPGNQPTWAQTYFFVYGENNSNLVTWIPVLKSVLI